jgi:hypothetical protein
VTTLLIRFDDVTPRTVAGFPVTSGKRGSIGPHSRCRVSPPFAPATPFTLVPTCVPLNRFRTVPSGAPYGPGHRLTPDRLRARQLANFGNRDRFSPTRQARDEPFW